MHLVVDMQGAQAAGHLTDPGRATIALAQAIARGKEGNRVTLLLSGLFAQTIEPIVAAMDGVLPPEAIRVWQGVGPTAAVNPDNDWRRQASERLREAFLAVLRPDVVLLTSVFAGYDDDSVCSLELLSTRIPAIAVLLAPVPQAGTAEPGWYRGQQELLRKCRRILVAPEVPPMTLAAIPGIDAQRIVPFPWEGCAQHIWKEVLGASQSSQGAASGLVNVDRTGIFRKRRLSILVTKLDHLGDFILSIPALAKLRARYPDAAIDAVVGSWNAGFARDLGFFRQVHAFDFFKRKSSEKASADDAELAGVLRALDTYDIAIDLRRQPDSRFFIVQTKAQLIVGYQTFDDAIDVRLDVMLRAYKESAHIRTPLNETPISVQMLRLVDALPPDANDYVSLPEICADVVRERGRVAIFPRAGTEVREWNKEKLLELADRFVASPQVKDVQVFFVNKAEAAQYGFVPGERLKVHVGLEFPAMQRLLASSNLCIANNSGGIHLSSYLGVPTIGIYSGHELAAEWGPQFHDAVAIHRGASCAPCHLGRKVDCRYDNFCLGDIAVEDVYRKSMEVLAGDGTRGPVGDAAAQAIAVQRSDDAIVADLMTGLAGHLSQDDPESWLEVSAVIAANHPGYAAPGDGSGTYHGIVNTVLDHRSDAIEWLGFSTPERQFRWTDGSTAAITFYLEGDVEVPAEARIVLVFDAFRKQRVTLKFNGIHAGHAVMSGRRNRLAVAVRNLRYGFNRLQLHLPDAASPGHGDMRELGIAVRRLKIIVEDGSASILRRQGNRLRNAVIQWR